ncbi:hypothetical protein [Aquimarina sp. AU474]|uniref:hypothetical protein n=1 Tax=Aquimarina sp. AU474 TaxID=2108529 RepID=UPI000D687E72|nr:hypothetical protein [Aquimarina sp. AU474]
MKHLSKILILFLFPSISFAQTNSDISPGVANANYFNLPRETLYLHVNKDTYINGEEIWFKGYVYDRQNNLAAVNSTNFTVALFDTSGKEVYDGQFLGHQGSVHGNIKIDSTLQSGDYYMRISTNWMNNFKEDESYTKRIKIIKDSITEKVSQKGLVYDFQLLPEGGHLVSNTFNTIGFKLINNQGYGVAFEHGIVQDELGNEITSFSSNTLGLGKFNITPQPGKKYTAIIKLRDGREITGEFPRIDRKGISISINNLIEDEVAIELNTNTATLATLKKESYSILVLKNHLSKKIKVDFKGKELKKKISLKRSDLYPGMNTLTLFKDNDPVVERLLFNPVDIGIESLGVTVDRTTKDSLSVAIEIPNQVGKTYDVSISTLPSETVSYNHSDNIQSAMLLRPYIKGFIENEKHYFTDVDRKKKYDLDLLLITQGWSKYQWRDIFNTEPKPLYNFNQGFKITGRIQDKKSDVMDQVYLYPSTNNSAKLIALASDNSFEIANFFPERGEKIKISGIKTKGGFKKPGVYLQVQSDRVKRPFRNTFPEIGNENINKIQNRTTVPFDFLTDVQVLDAVEVTGNNQKKIKKTSRIQIPKYYDLNAKEVTLDMAERFFSIVDYLFFTGKYVITDRNNPINLRVTSRKASFSGPVPVTIFLDDFQLNSENVGILSDLRLADVDKIYTDHIGHGVGSRGGGGSIRIYTRRFPLIRTREPDRNYTEYEFTKGFEPVKEFYNPGYANYLDPFFVSYGAIHWQPRLDFNQQGVATFTIPNTGLENISLFIEGMGSDGTLISKMHIIKNINPN